MHLWYANMCALEEISTSAAVSIDAPRNLYVCKISRSCKRLDKSVVSPAIDYVTAFSENVLHGTHIGFGQIQIVIDVSVWHGKSYGILNWC